MSRRSSGIMLAANRWPSPVILNMLSNQNIPITLLCPELKYAVTDGNLEWVRGSFYDAESFFRAAEGNDCWLVLPHKNLDLDNLNEIMPNRIQKAFLRGAVILYNRKMLHEPEVKLINVGFGRFVAILMHRNHPRTKKEWHEVINELVRF